ncbi:AAA domain-containing protein [Fluoribacter gormanii]|uniref:AAA domain-containing protein n=1 Tax=Fluoribacter gormanii TaxID=464 RepID=UPI002243B45B|nr:AAA domain-containing protein [Fluoribacter gormanii]MCW8444196.1 AAA domain-containing protein [Fluoribacter gormanii]
MTIYVRKCQGCKDERPAEEILCQICGWSLMEEPLFQPGESDVTHDTKNLVASADYSRLCENGHPMDENDEICFVPGCGALSVSTVEPELSPISVLKISDWTIIEKNESEENFFERYLVEKHGCTALLTYYVPDTMPTIPIHNFLKKISSNNIPEILDSGEWEGRQYEVVSFLSKSSLSDLTSVVINAEFIKGVVNSIGKVLASLSENGFRHGNIRPEHIVISEKDQRSFYLTGFEYRQPSNFDLDLVTLPKSVKYQSPEVLAGGISQASDWWSLGIVLLDLITKGRFTQNINEKAFCIHIITRGISLPDDIEPNIKKLLQGLLIRDPDKRWQWPEVKRWLKGEYVEVFSEVVDEEKPGLNFEFKEKIYTCPKLLALSAAEEQNWDEAKDVFMRGAIATWLESCQLDSKVTAGIRVAAALDSISEDYRFSLALLWLNPNLPLIYRGDIITTTWLLQNPVHGYELITSPLVSHLRQMRRELYLCDLFDRSERVRERAKLLQIELNENRLKILLLATSRQNLERQWAIHRQLFPGSEHVGLNSLLERQKTTDEELIILLAAETHQFESAEQILNQANELAIQYNLASFDQDVARSWFDFSRKDIYKEIETRVTNYSQCGIARVDEWANDFTTQYRLPLPKSLILLSIPKEQWKEPEKALYLSKILEFFEKRAVFQAQRGALVRMVISRSNSRIDLYSIKGNKPTSSFILEHLIGRTATPISLDRIAFEDDIELEKKLRHLVSHADIYRRDTGIDSLFLGFPFLILKESTQEGASVKPKIAPILLWPIKINIEARGRVNINFDQEREEVRLNPALIKILGTEEVKLWTEILQEILSRSSLRIVDVMDAFGALAELRERELCSLPNSDYTIPANQRQIVCSAVLFHAAFMGQALSEDLRQIRKMSSDDTCLESILRVNKTVLPHSSPFVSEKDRYFTMESDPSQEKAVFEARQLPGLLIEGPPGTGKSQTIVNIIADCIGKKQTVLVICQKSAALEVLAKRLHAEGLSERFFYVTHVNKDRTPVIQEIRNQREGLPQTVRVGEIENINRQRNELAMTIERLENEIDKHHEAIHTIDDKTGLTYRLLIGQLINLEEQVIEVVDVPALRNILSDISPEKLTQYGEVCAPISGLWFESCFENSPLSELKSFSSDNALINEFKDLFQSFIQDENKRNSTIQEVISSFEIEEDLPHRSWIDTYNKSLKEADWNNIGNWFHMFSRDSYTSKGSQSIKKLEELNNSLSSFDSNCQDVKMSNQLMAISEAKLKRWCILAKSVYSTRQSIWTRINPIKIIKTRAMQKILSELGEEFTIDKVQQLKIAIEFELNYRPIRESILKISNLFFDQTMSPASLFLNDFMFFSDQLLKKLVGVHNDIIAIYACPRQQDIQSIVNGGLQTYEELVKQYEQAFKRYHVRFKSLTSLDKLLPFLGDELFNICSQNIKNNLSNIEKLESINKVLYSLAAYQDFRVQSALLPDAILKIFSILREKEIHLKKYSLEQLNNIIPNIIAREARLGWKDRLEQVFPVLRLEQKELTRKIQQLAQSSEKMRELNRKHLSCNINLLNIKSSQEWEDITRLRGPRSRRLREIMDRGWDMGLTELRPVWLMNPDTASQLLPLRAGMFDVVIFDEASQIPIENAIPTLYRAKRTIISGDEKQMPPSNLFTKKLIDDEEYILDSDDIELDEFITEAERDELEDIWNRREIKDCSDLLTLGKTVLPRTMLQIHYRSKYRELIAFSNSAFYGNCLSVPVRHPESVICDIKPLELIRVNGVYSNQTNRQEAEKVIEILHHYWSKPKRPSIGIVTFNAKQADLIEDVLTDYSEQDQHFRQMLSQEKARNQEGEDMGFFIKNVENVQGDERDIIIFSSTFGKDEHGGFRRNFGLLSQTGGERRLNVAITRAREKVILITSLPIDKISDCLEKRQPPQIPRDYIQAYFHYASKISDGFIAEAYNFLGAINTNTTQTGHDFSFDKDGFINSVAKFIKGLGLNPLSIKENDAFGLDLVIEDLNKKRFAIGIECDAHCHSILANARAREIWRPKVLNMEIPYIHRVTSFGWYHKRKIEMQNLIQVLEVALDIELKHNFSTHLEEINEWS